MVVFVLAPPWSLPFGSLGAAAEVGGGRVPAWLPVVAAALAWLVLGQELTATQLVGAAVLLSGASVVQLASRATGRMRSPA